MPELPEVETIRRILRERIVGETIQGVDLSLPRLIRTPSEIEEFRQILTGLTFQDVTRRGKYLLFHLSPFLLISHLRMEGKYSLHPMDDPVEKHTHLIFRLTSGKELRYQDVRQFGTFDLIPEGEIERIPGLARLGIEPLTPAFTLDAFKELLMLPSKRSIKAFLLDQKKVAGLGNIYADEALFHAGIDPERPIRDLTAEEIEKLYTSIEDVIQKGIQAGGATVRTYRNSDGEMGYFQLQISVYGREGKPCPSCGSPIVKKVVAGRGTHYCPGCQK
ncbi:DNA-formamidopyrimidine glycosylase [Thermicanus aegyptius]|uniref:DNA-formamidopyrimidine glycosylase n=1 Tax=Thermicanus aegyptius TaxID=94009 RepID=UPI00041A626B|nr:DNA-formamidopyrimidine glycosylase [Thermicanus aegyptius]